MQSHFNAHMLAEIFRDLYMSERRGVLTLAHDEVEKRVYLDRGLIFYADSNQTAESLRRHVNSVQVLVQRICSPAPLRKTDARAEPGPTIVRSARSPKRQCIRQAIPLFRFRVETIFC